MLRLLTAMIVLFSFSTIPNAIRQYQMFLDAYQRQQSGDQAGAAKIYADLLSRYPDSFIRREALFNMAVAEYSQNRFSRAAALNSGLQTTKGPIGVNAAYNRGNALAQIAFADPRARDYQNQLRASLVCYRQALIADPNHTDARINYEIVLRALRRLNPPPSPSGGGSGGAGGGDRQTRQQGLSVDISNMILDNARLQEGQMMRKYFKPAPPRQNAKEEEDW